MCINRFQYFSQYDSLRDFKTTAVQKYTNCSFFNHDINSITTVNMGNHDNISVSEKIITDGSISLEKITNGDSMIIWENHLLTLEDGRSLEIKIDGANFIVASITYGDEIHHEIHVEQEDKELLTRILNLIYEQKGSTLSTSSITFKTPSIVLLESFINKRKIRETLDLKTGKSIKKRIIK